MVPTINDNIGKIIKLLEYKFELLKNNDFNLQKDKRVKVFIMSRDIDELKIYYVDLRLLLPQIASKIPEMEVNDMFTDDDTGLGVLEWEKEITGEERPFATILLPKDFMEKAKKLGAEITGTITGSKTEKENNKKDIQIVLHLNVGGELWKEPKNKHCYSMEKTSDRHKIVRYFAENEIYEYFPTQELANKLKEGDTKKLVKEIGNINTNARGKIHLECRIMEGKKDSGYRISSIYKIVLKKN